MSQEFYKDSKKAREVAGDGRRGTQPCVRPTACMTLKSSSRKSFRSLRKWKASPESGRYSCWCGYRQQAKTSEENGAVISVLTDEVFFARIEYLRKYLVKCTPPSIKILLWKANTWARTQATSDSAIVAALSETRLQELYRSGVLKTKVTHKTPDKVVFVDM